MDPSLKMSLCLGPSESGHAEKTFGLCTRGILRGTETTEGVWLCKRRVVTCEPVEGGARCYAENRPVYELRCAVGCVFFFFFSAGASQQVQPKLNEATFAVLIGVTLLPHPCRLSQGGKEVSRRCGRS